MRSKLNPSGPGDKAETCERDRAEDRSIRTAAAIDQKKNREESVILVHSGQISHEK